MTETASDDVELLYQLLTDRVNMAEPDQIDEVMPHQIQLRFDVPDGEGCVYVQCMPFAVQAYDSDDRDDRELVDATWDELCELGASDVPHRTNLSDLRGFAHKFRQ